MGRKAIWTEPVLGRNRQQFIERCQSAIAAGQEDSFIYLVATRALLDHITARVLDGRRVTGCRELRVFLFDGLTQRILKHAGVERRLIEDNTKYFLLEQIIAQLTVAGALQHIPAIALLPGTIESVGNLIGEIKRAGMPPDVFREFANTAKPQPRDLDVAAIYEAYQQLLDERALMDADEAAVRALDVLRTRPDVPPWLSHTTTLFIDGFFDFTPIQKHLLRYLIERIPEVIINLTYDPRHPSVFAEPLQDTFKFLDSLSEPAPIEHFAATLPYQTELDPLRVGLFNPEASASSSRPPITILTAASLSHEAQEIAKEIQRLILEQGYCPYDIAVIAREPSGYLQAVDHELTRLGIPSALSIQEPLTSIPSVKAALKILQCRVGQEETEPYLALLKNDYLEHFSSLNRDAIENAVLVVGVQLPIRQWRRRVKDIRRIKEHQMNTLTSRLVDMEEVELELARIQRGLAQLDGALAAIDGMREALALIPEGGSLSELIRGWLAALRAFRLGERLHEQLKEAGLNEPDLRLLALDLRGLDALRQTLEEIQRITETTGHGPRTTDQLTVEQFHDLIVHLLQRTPFRAERGDPGGVRLLEATQARGLPFSAVFIVGLRQGLFPMSPARDWIYPHPERQKLADAGLYLEDLSPKLFEVKEEHFFYHAACQATERLYLTYPRADATGEENVVSSFVEEIQKLYHDGHDSLVPVEELSPSAYDVRRIASPTEMARGVLASLYQTTADDALVLNLYNQAVASGFLTSLVFTRLRIEEERQGQAFGPFDGRLTNSVIRQQLRGRFGPNRVYSASQLNTYGRCPFQFFCQRILRLEEREEASLDLVAMDRGWLLHTILHDFLQRHTDTNLIWPRRREYQEELDKVAEEVFNHYEQKALPIHSGLWELQKEEIRDTLRQFLDAEIKYQEQVSSQGVQPHWLELGFGMTDLENCHPDSHKEHFVLKREKDLIKLRGRIDRADRSADGKYIVYDYKSGAGAGLEEMREGVDLQIPLYIRALAESFLNPGEEVIGGGYYSLKRFDRNRGLYREEFQTHTAIGSRAKSSLSTEEWEQLLEDAEAFAWNYVDGMRRGDFRVEPKEDACCPRCIYQTVCRYDKHRIQAKAKTDEAS